MDIDRVVQRAGHLPERARRSGDDGGTLRDWKGPEESLDVAYLAESMLRKAYEVPWHQAMLTKANMELELNA